MGYSISWIAIRGKDRDVVCSEFHVEPTGEFEDVPESPVVGARLPTGWYLLFINDRSLPGSGVLGKLSTRAELVCCFVEEHVMCSSASGWQNGKEQWSVTRDAQQGLTHLESTGDLPWAYAAIHDDLSRKQVGKTNVDYLFDIPVELAKSLTGFRHDEDFFDAPSKPYERLQRTVAPGKWWQFWK
jgi:hypothetical protein